MIVITGAAGFIGSCLVRHLNNIRFFDLVLVDDFSKTEKSGNLEGKQFTAKVERREFADWLRQNHKLVQFVYHLGARTDTTEFDASVFDELNVEYSKEVWNICVEFGLPLVYASSAATYGGGELGYSDDHSLSRKLKPLNPYGVSKNEFDIWALEQERKPYFWAGLKFFNVYGPNEYHKGRMASVIFHAFNQVQKRGYVELFRSHKEGIPDGGQQRDFIYVKDIARVCEFLMRTRGQSGIFNLGTGKARSFYDLAAAVFRSLDLEPDVRFIDTPEDIREKYQYYTCAEMKKLRAAGYTEEFIGLEEGVADYVKNYLLPNRYF